MEPTLENCICIKDIEKLAAERLKANARLYFNSVATDGQTAEENCTAFKKWRFQPRVLQDVSKVDTTTTVLGHEISFPICAAATTLNEMASIGGELDIAKAAANLKTGFTLGCMASTSIEELNTHVPSVLRWFQLYPLKDRDVTTSLVKRVEKNGFRAIMVSVDSPVIGLHYNFERIKFLLPSEGILKNFVAYDQFSRQTKDLEGPDLAEVAKSLWDSAMSWANIDWLKTITNLPIIVKGILTREMALEAVSHGVDGILVSNHGGRVLDSVLPTINALPQVIQAVQGRCEVYLDSGIRNGGDVAKAIALGARAVFVGRPMIWGLACGGEEGARKVLEILRDEFEHTMKLLGTKSIAELQMLPNLVIHESQIFTKGL